MRPRRNLRLLTSLAILLSASYLCAQNGIRQDLSFCLPDLDGNLVKLEKYEEAKYSVVCFLGTECPLAKLYASRLNEIARDFPTVNFVAVCSNQQDSIEDLRGYRDRHQLGFPVVKDTNNIVADQFKAQRTPEVFVVDNELLIRYRGRIDDQYQPGIAKSLPSRHDLQIALNECLAGKPVSIAKTEPDGCLIGRIKNDANPNSKITYANQISRLLQNHCAECHRKGEIGPMEFADYGEVSGWADMIVEVVNENRMPPWHADPKHGDFINERRISTAEKQMLMDWVAAGTPMGELDQLPAPRQQAKSTDWRLSRQPDAVFEMRAKPFTVPAEGTVEYQYFVIDPDFKEDKWVIAAEILPGNRSVLHHSIVFVRPPDGAQFRGIGWLAAYVPGQSAPMINPKFGRMIPAGSKLVFQQHYTPMGIQTTDNTRIGLIFGDEQEIENEVFTQIALDQEFVIPPGSENYEVAAKFRNLPKNGYLMGYSPHMHFRGKSFELTARLAQTDSDKTTTATTLTGNTFATKTLLKVPNYDFNWQHIYQLKQPIPIANIESLEFVAAFDNSKDNPMNPDPGQHVTWGDQTWEEMAVAFVIVSQPREAEQPETVERSPEQVAAQTKYLEFIDQQANAFTDEFFTRFDADGDGKVSKSELPRSIRQFGHRQLDTNLDGFVTREEIHQNAKFRFVRKFPREKFDPVLSD